MSSFIQILHLSILLFLKHVGSKVAKVLWVPDEPVESPEGRMETFRSGTMWRYGTCQQAYQYQYQSTLTAATGNEYLAQTVVKNTETLFVE